MRDCRGSRGREASLIERLHGKRYRPTEIGARLGQADQAVVKRTLIAEVARLFGVSEVTLHQWRVEDGAVDCDAVRRLKDLKKENAQLKRLVAHQQLNSRA